MIIMLRRHEKRIKYFFSYEQNISLKWLKSFVLIIVINSLLEVIIAFFSLYVPSLPIEITYTYYIILFILITTLGYFGIRQTDIYTINSSGFNTPQYEPSYANEVTIAEKSIDIDLLNKTDEDLEIFPLHYMISTEEQKRIVSDVINLIESEKIFQNPKLSVYDFADKLNTNKTYISVSINNILKKNFRQFINEYRINEAKRLLTDPAFDHLSIDGIGQTVGFVSKSTFNLAFKKFTNEKPSDYKKLKRNDQNT